MTQIAECPACSKVNEYGDSCIGQYVRCAQCNCRFYVVVPPLERDHAPVESTPHLLQMNRNHAPATADDILYDSRQGQSSVLKLLRQQDAHFSKLERHLSTLQFWLAILAGLIALNLAMQIVFRP